MSQLQRELNSEKDSFKQTIESLEQFSIHLQLEGESQQNQIQVLTSRLGESGERGTISEFRLLQVSQDNLELEAELEKLTASMTGLRQKLFETDVELKIARMERLASEESIKDTLALCSPQHKRLLEEKIYTLEQELEDLKWRLTGSEIHKIELMNAKELANREAIQFRQQLQQSQASLESSRADLSKFQSEVAGKIREKVT